MWFFSLSLLSLLAARVYILSFHYVLDVSSSKVRIGKGHAEGGGDMEEGPAKAGPSLVFPRARRFIDGEEAEEWRHVEAAEAAEE